MASLPEMALPPPTSGQVRAPAPFDPTRWVGQACAALMNPYCIVESNGKRWLCYRPPVVGSAISNSATNAHGTGCCLRCLGGARPRDGRRKKGRERACSDRFFTHMRCVSAMTAHHAHCKRWLVQVEQSLLPKPGAEIMIPGSACIVCSSLHSFPPGTGGAHSSEAVCVRRSMCQCTDFSVRKCRATRARMPPGPYALPA